jgi:Uncharacterised nucleotidyltransferase
MLYQTWSQHVRRASQKSSEESVSIEYWEKRRAAMAEALIERRIPNILLELLCRRHVVRLPADAECKYLLAVAEEEHVLPWTVASLRLRSLCLNPAILSELQAIERGAAIAAFFWASELKGILYEFEKQDLVVVPLKGPFLADRLYGACELRVNQDLDLLVSRNDLTRAETVLTAAGFTPGFPDDYHRQWYRKTTTVELHHDVDNPLDFDFRVEGALRQARQAFFQGQRCWQLAPADELLFLCLHAARHRFERLNLVLDLKLAFENLARCQDAERVRPEVAALGDLLTLGLAMAQRLEPKLTMPFEVSLSPNQVDHLNQLADRLWHRLLTERSETLDWRSLHAFYLEIEAPGRPRMQRRIRHLRILASRVIEQDYKFAAAFGLHRRWQVQMLRPLRLLSDLVPR